MPNGHSSFAELLCVNVTQGRNALVENYYRTSHGFLLCFAINDKYSLKVLDSAMERLTAVKYGAPFATHLVALKSDLTSVISEQEMKEFETKHGVCGYSIASAVQDKNCKETIDKMINLTLQKLIPDEIVEQAGRGISITGKNKKCSLS